MRPAELSIEEQVELRGVLTIDEPLGPSKAEDLANTPLAGNLLFERQNAIYSALRSRSGILVGRRGSGKTAFLNQLRTAGEFEFLVFINAPNVFPEILRGIRDLFGDKKVVVEVVEKLWDILVWCCVFSELLKKNSDARLVYIRDFANRIGFSPENRPEVVILKVVEAIQKRTAGKLIDTPLRLEVSLDFEVASFSAACAAATKLLRARKQKTRGAGTTGSPVLVLMDTLESYRLGTDLIEAAIAGLLRYLGQQAQNRGLMDIRFCLPAEIYEEFHRASTNAMKDFSSQTVLHWHPGDLLAVAAHRLSLYLQLYDPERYDLMNSKFDLNRREGAVGFIHSILPERVINRNGVKEFSLAYILRHTQLLPRHVVEVFNRTLSGIIEPATMHFNAVPQSAIIQGIRNCEPSICRGVAQAYDTDGEQFLSRIWEAIFPELPRRFTDGDLQRVFNIHAKAVLKRLRDEGKTGGDLDYQAFKQKLVEAGAIGKQIRETELYYEAEFEYTHPGMMIIATKDLLCTHPLFSGVYPHSPAWQEKHKAVYAVGSDPHIAN